MGLLPWALRGEYNGGETIISNCLSVPHKPGKIMPQMYTRLQKFPFVLQLILLCIVYYFTAILGLKIGAVSGFATLVWEPTGISLASILIFGYKVWPAITIGAFLANFTTGAPVGAAVGISVGNTLEAVVAAYFLRNVLGFHNSLDRLKDILWLIIFAALLSTMISATLGVFSLYIFGVIPVSALRPTWIAWWIGDMMSNLVTAPLLLVWSVGQSFRFSLQRLFEAFSLLLIVLTIGSVIFLGVFGFTTRESPITYLVFPPLIWAALRFGQRTAVSVVAILSIVAIWATVHGFGPFTLGTLSENLLQLQSFMAVTVITTMLLTAAYSERRQLERRREEFISVAGHELKTPLTAIKANTQILQKQLAQLHLDNKVRVLPRIDVQINKLTVLVNELLDFTKIQSGKLVLDKHPINFDKLVKQVVSDLRQTYTNHVIQIKGKVNGSVIVDEDRISQVLTNLIENAIKYSPKGKRVIIRLHQAKGDVFVSVQDFGVGIDKDEQLKIFDRFYRVESEMHTQGHGLGLYIASDIVKRHGGDIWVESTPGKGSIFSFTLPIK